MDRRYLIEFLVDRNYTLRRSTGVNLQPSTAFGNFTVQSRCSLNPRDGSLSNSTLLHLFAIYLNEFLAIYRKEIVRQNEWIAGPDIQSGFIQMGNTFQSDFGELNARVDTSTVAWLCRGNDNSECSLPLVGAVARTCYDPSGVTVFGQFEAGAVVLELGGFRGSAVVSRLNFYLRAGGEGGLVAHPSDPVNQFTFRTGTVDVQVREWGTYLVTGPTSIRAVVQTAGAFRVRLYPRIVPEENMVATPMGGAPSIASSFIRPEELGAQILALWNTFIGRFPNFTVEASEPDLYRMNKTLRMVNAVYDDGRRQ